MINFVGPKGETAASAIEADGTYFCPNAPTGQVKVGIVSDKPVAHVAVGKPGGSAPPAPPAGPDPSKWFPIDAKYADPNTSGKEITLKSGANVINIELE
jgi:hypothetical protein